MPENFDLSKILAGLDAKIAEKKGEFKPTPTTPESTPPATPEKSMITDVQIRNKAGEYLDHWIGTPGGLPPDGKGYMVEAFINNGNKNEGITPENLREWLPGYTTDQIHKLGEEIRREAVRRDKEASSSNWTDLIR